MRKSVFRVSNQETWPQGYKTFSCSTQLSMEFVLLINVKMQTIDGILTFFSRINDWLFSFLTQLSMEFILLINVRMPTIVGILTFISRIND